MAFRPLLLALAAILPLATAHAQPAPGYDGAWQGSWVGPDGQTWQGSWSGTYRTGGVPDPSAPRGWPATVRMPGSDEAMVIVPVVASSVPGADPRLDWQAECQHRILAGGGQDIAQIGQACAAWQAYYENSGYWQPGLAYAVPVRLITIPGATIPCPTPPAPPPHRPAPPHHHHDKRIRLDYPD